MKKIRQKAEDVARDNDDIDTTDYVMTEDLHDPVIFHNLKVYDI